MKITLRSHPVVTAELVADNGQTRLIQTDLDAPGIASAFGWSIKDVQPTAIPCDHDGTDGTVQCQTCALKAETFITAALDWISQNDGAEIEDPGYFD